MNILFFSELFYPHGGGAEFATYLYAKLLSKVGLNVVVVTNKFTGEQAFSKSKNLTIYRLPLFKSKTGIKYSVLRRLDVPLSSFMKKLMKWTTVVYIPRLWYSMIPVAKIYKKPTMVHIHDYIPICSLGVLYNSSRQDVCKNKTLCSARCLYQFEKNKNSNVIESVMSTSLNLFARFPLRKCIEQADAVICVSKAQRDILTNHIPLINYKTHVIYNPLPDLAPIELNGNDFGYFGGLNLLKGFRVLYDALASINDPSLRVHVTGISTLKEEITKSFDHRGMVLHQKLEYTKQESFYRQIKGVIFPSITPEPLPYVTAEAILRGRILIASKIGGIPEQAKGCKGVFLFEACNHRELAEIISYVRDLDKGTILDLSCQNREVFIKNFNNEKTIDGFVNTIDHLI